MFTVYSAVSSQLFKFLSAQCVLSISTFKNWQLYLMAKTYRIIQMKTFQFSRCCSAGSNLATAHTLYTSDHSVSSAEALHSTWWLTGSRQISRVALFARIGSCTRESVTMNPCHSKQNLPQALNLFTFSPFLLSLYSHAPQLKSAVHLHRSESNSTSYLHTHHKQCPSPMTHSSSSFFPLFYI